MRPVKDQTRLRRGNGRNGRECSACGDPDQIRRVLFSKDPAVNISLFDNVTAAKKVAVIALG